MTVILTATARTRNWRAFDALNRARLVDRAREAGATRYRVYRDARDAAELLVVVEFPNQDSVFEVGRDIAELIEALLGGGASDDRVWEPTDLDGIG